MDIQRLVGEVAKKHHVLLSPDDPIFVSVTLYEALLAEHLQRVQDAVEKASRSILATSAGHVEAARAVASELVVESARLAGDQVRDAGMAVRRDLEVLVEATLQAHEVESAHERTTRYAAAVALGAALVAVASVFFVWLRGR